MKLMNEALTLSLRQNTDQLLKEISRFDYPAFNHRTSEEKWTAGEIAEHLLMFDIRLNSILRGESIPANRDPQENSKAMEERLTDKNRAFVAPDFLIPTSTAKDPGAMADRIIAERSNLLNFTRNADLSLLYPNAPHRFFGVLSAIEWINFLIHHTNRHIQQLALLTI